MLSYYTTVVAPSIQRCINFKWSIIISSPSWRSNRPPGSATATMVCWIMSSSWPQGNWWTALCCSFECDFSYRWWSTVVVLHQNVFKKVFHLPKDRSTTPVHCACPSRLSTPQQRPSSPQANIVGDDICRPIEIWLKFVHFCFGCAPRIDRSVGQLLGVLIFMPSTLIAVVPAKTDFETKDLTYINAQN